MDKAGGNNLKGVAFFSGGKDGLYAMYLAEKQEIEVPYLLALKTTIGISPHYENLSELKKLVDVMGKELLIFDMREGSEALADFISSLDVDYIIAGDILLEDHFKWVKWLAKRAETGALEPLWGRNTLGLAKEMLNAGFEYAIIAVNREKLSKEWLGYAFSSLGDLELFLEASPEIDPIGEFGEFHTVVLNCPLFKKSFELKPLRIKESGRYWWLNFRLVET